MYGRRKMTTHLVAAVTPIDHNDTGWQCTSVRFIERLLVAGLAPSTGVWAIRSIMPSPGNLWSTIKVEVFYWPATTFAACGL
jgi:putative transposase